MRHGSVEEWPEILKDLKKAKANIQEFVFSMKAVKDKLDKGFNLQQEISLIEEFVKQTDHGSV